MKELIADQLGYFTVHDIAAALIGVVAAALLGYATALLARAKGPGPREMAVTAAVMAFAAFSASVSDFAIRPPPASSTSSVLGMGRPMVPL